jgi:peptidoglycan/xylan/chitin deacetylase (PgdA/CDA1 family)
VSAAQAAKRLARRALYRSGAWGLYHRVRNRRALTVLMFHRVLPADHPALPLAEREFTFTLDGFRRTLDFVQRHYRVVSLRQVLAAKEQGKALPPNPVLITFDDGWRDTVAYALPELQARGMSALLFVAWGAVDEHPERWWQDALVSAMARPSSCAALCEQAGWGPEAARRPDVHRRLSAWMAEQPHAQRQALLERAAPGVWSAVAERQMLNDEELGTWLQAGMELGSHGISHAPLTHSGQPADELRQSLQRLRARAKGMPANMSFPHGASNADLLRQAREVGYGCLFTSDPTLQAWPPRQDGLPTIGRVHVPESEWTCERGQIAAERLAVYLFPRPRRAASTAA